MKNFTKWLGIIAFVAIIGFSMAACKPGDDNGDGGQDSGPLFSVSGGFTKGSVNAVFKAQTSASARSARAATDDLHDLAGELEDGDILFRLKGTYNETTGNYSISAASSVVRYTINGGDNGATATVAVYTGGEWQSFVVSVTIKEVSVKDGEALDYAGGIPESMQGFWQDWWTADKNDLSKNSFQTNAYFNQWYYEAYESKTYGGNTEYTPIKYTIVESSSLGSGVYDVIFTYPYYNATVDQKKAAAASFLKSVGINNGQFWSYEYGPWEAADHFGDPDGEYGDAWTWDNTVIWLVTANNQIGFVNWDTFETLMKAKGYADGSEQWGGVWGSYAGKTTKSEIEAAIAEYFTEIGIKNVNYNWDQRGWPVAEEGFLDANYEFAYILYYIDFGGKVKFSGWEKIADKLERWYTEDYYNVYLSNSVSPETWYSRARLSMDGNTFVIQYYTGNDEGPNEGHYVASCDTKSLATIKNSSITKWDANYWDFSYLYQRTRTSPRF